MIQRIKDKRRARAARKRGIVQPQPCWVEAFLILLLRKADILTTKLQGKPCTDGKLTVSIEALKKFEKLKLNNKTSISFDVDNQTVTLKAPKIKVSDIILPDSRIIT